MPLFGEPRGPQGGRARRCLVSDKTVLIKFRVRVQGGQTDSGTGKPTVTEVMGKACGYHVSHIGLFRRSWVGGDSGKGRQWTEACMREGL